MRGGQSGERARAGRGANKRAAADPTMRASMTRRQRIPLHLCHLVSSALLTRVHYPPSASRPARTRGPRSACLGTPRHEACLRRACCASKVVRGGALAGEEGSRGCDQRVSRGRGKSRTGRVPCWAAATEAPSLPHRDGTLRGGLPGRTGFYNGGRTSGQGGGGVAGGFGEQWRTDAMRQHGVCVVGPGVLSCAEARMRLFTCTGCLPFSLSEEDECAEGGR